MYKRILLVIITLFCGNTLLSLLPSCKTKNGRRTYNNTCKQAYCMTINSSNAILYDVANKKQLSGNPPAVLATDLAIKVRFDGTNTVCYKQKNERDRNFSLFTAAYAEPAIPLCPILYGNDSIVSYDIYSSRDFDNAHPAGTSLNDIISTEDIPLRPLQGYYPAATFECEFNLNTLPAESGIHSFVLKFAKKNGDTVEVITPSVNLLK